MHNETPRRDNLQCDKAVRCCNAATLSSNGPPRKRWSNSFQEKTTQASKQALRPNSCG